MDKIKIGLIGCGKIARKHLQAIDNFPDQLKLVSLCDANQSALANFQQTYPVAGYQNLAEMLATQPIDLLSICTPSGLHSQQAIQALQVGKHVVVEKPMATNAVDAKKMIAVAQKADKKLLVVKPLRLLATLQYLREVLAQNKLGKIYLINLNVFWTRPQSYYDQCRWRGTRNLDGGALMNQASHYVDLLTWLFGPIKNLHAKTATLARDIEMEDSCVLSIAWQNGMLGSMNVTMLSYPKNFETSLTILAERGTIKLTGNALTNISHWEVADNFINQQQLNNLQAVSNDCLANLHTGYYANVIDSLHNLAKPAADGEAGLESINTIMAAYQSEKEFAYHD